MSHLRTLPPNPSRVVAAADLRLWINLLVDVAAYLEALAEDPVAYQPVHLRLRCLATARKLEQIHG